MDFILASASPRRKELLEQIGLNFEIIKSDVEEVITKTLPGDIVMELSRQKAMDVASKLNKKACVIGSDTIVSVNNRVLGKPKNQSEAYEMIKSIQGRYHQVYTGVAVVISHTESSPEPILNFADLTEVNVYPMTEEQIIDYINTNEPYDKAGAYGIQGLFGKHVKGIKGDYNTVVGLPIARLYNELFKLGILN